MPKRQKTLRQQLPNKALLHTIIIQVRAAQTAAPAHSPEDQAEYIARAYWSDRGLCKSERWDLSLQPCPFLWNCAAQSETLRAILMIPAHNQTNMEYFAIV